MCFSFKLLVQHSVLVEIFMSEPVVDGSCSGGQSLSGSLSAENALAFGVIDWEPSPPPPCHLRRIHLLEGKKRWQPQATSLLSFYTFRVGYFFPFSVIYPLVCTWPLRNKRNITVKFWRTLQAQRKHQSSEGMVKQQKFTERWISSQRSNQLHSNLWI